MNVIISVEAESSITPNCRSEDPATWRKFSQGTVADENVRRAGFTVVGNRKELTVTVN